MDTHSLQKEWRPKSNQADTLLVVENVVNNIYIIKITILISKSIRVFDIIYITLVFITLSFRVIKISNYKNWYVIVA